MVPHPRAQFLWMELSLCLDYTGLWASCPQPSRFSLRILVATVVGEGRCSHLAARRLRRRGCWIALFLLLTLPVIRPHTTGGILNSGFPVTRFNHHDSLVHTAVVRPTPKGSMARAGRD